MQMASRTTTYFESQISFSSTTAVDERLEFQESDIWMISPSSSPGFHHIQTPPNSSRKRPSVVSPAPPSSLPLNIPDWSKIRSEEDEAADNDDSSDEEEEDHRVPPHEYAARQASRRSGMVVAYSVHHGTSFKARDLRRLRNAIWKHTTGFQD